MSASAESTAGALERQVEAQSAEQHPPIDGSGDPQAIEHNIDQTRDRLRHILEALQSKLSPTQILDRGVHYLKDNGTELTRGLGRRIRRNPTPVLLTAVGIALLLSVRAVRRHPAPRPRSAGPGVTDRG